MKVAVGIISDTDGRILVTRRPLHVPHGGYWEFPGGKLDNEETPEQALVREIKEEVGLEIKQHHYLGAIHHDYPDRSVCLFIFKVTEYTGIPKCHEGQLDMKWIPMKDVKWEDFPEANHKIIQLINLNDT